MGVQLNRAARNIRWIETFCRIPEGQFVGQPVRLRGWQKRVIRGIYGTDTRRAIISFGRKNAKALALDTPIATPSGWRTIADIEPGDSVFGVDGSPVRVLAVSEVFRGKPCYRVRFSDGSDVVASGDHLWTTRHRYRPWAETRRNGSGSGGRAVVDTVTTEQIAGSVLVARRDGGIERNHKIDAAAALQTQAIDLPIDPYLLGLWLGDGTSAAAALTTGAQDLAAVTEQLQAVGQDFRVRPDRSCFSILLTDGDRSQKARDVSFRAKLRSAGVLNNKHIPARYFAAGTAQRWSLLQGLMDTDGTVNRCGGLTTARCSFSNTNERLARETWRLCRSLGLKATVSVGEAKLNGQVVGPVYQVAFAADQTSTVFRLERKQALLPERLGKRSGTLTIVACEPVDSVPAKCLMVDAADSLFVVGHGCIPTHNTTLAGFLCLLHLAGPEAVRNSQLYSAAQSRTQAALLFDLMSKMVRMSPDLDACVHIRDSTKILICEDLGTVYRALSAEASTAYGLSPVFTVHDELGQVVGPRSELYEALETGSGAHQKPLSVIISTQAPTDADLLSLLIDDAKGGHDPRTKLFVWSAPDDIDPFCKTAVKRANPALGDFLNEAEVMEMAAAAKRMPSREAAFRNLVLNQRVNKSNPFISAGVWKENGADPRPEDFETGVTVALDLSELIDLTALVYVGRGGDGAWSVGCEFFAPEEGVADRSQRDRVPYDLWAKQGYLTLTPGASVDYAVVAGVLGKFCEAHDVALITFDRWAMRILRAELGHLGFDDLPLEEKGHGQGTQDMTPALIALETALKDRQLRHGNHPILTWCAANAVVYRGPAGDRKLNKAKSTGRIDGMVALAMAINRAISQEESRASGTALFA